jgi:hypothetical protein
MSSLVPAVPERPQRVVLAGPEDVVAAVPYLLGHEPRRCLVALAVRVSGDIGVVCRVDLPDDPAHVRPVTDRVAVALAADSAHTALVAAYVDPEREVRPAVGVLDALVAELRRQSIQLSDALLVHGPRYRSVLCTDPSCCPPGGRSVADAKDRPVAVQFVVSGRSPVRDRSDLEPAAVPAPRTARRSAATAAARWRRRVSGGLDPGERCRLLEEWFAVLDDHRRLGVLPGPAAVGRLSAAWADDVRIRDAAMVSVLPAAGLVPDSLIAGTPTDLAEVLAARSCAGAVHPVAPVLRHMAGHVAGPLAASVLAVHAWVAWVSGAGAAAGDLASRAVEADPGHRLATLVVQLLDRAVPPDWAAPAVVRARAWLGPGPPPDGLRPAGAGP